MAGKMPRHPEAFGGGVRQRQPREHAKDHLGWLHELPCCNCMAFGRTQAAHIRYGSPIDGKPKTGMAEKPSDKFTVPLCDRCHLNGPDAQHSSGEREWWKRMGIDPCILALRLWGCSGDTRTALTIIGLTNLTKGNFHG